MHCAACVKLVTRRLEKLNGAERVTVEADGRGELQSSRRVSLEEIREVLEGTEYSVTLA